MKQNDPLLFISFLRQAVRKEIFDVAFRLMIAALLSFLVALSLSHFSVDLREFVRRSGDSLTFEIWGWGLVAFFSALGLFLCLGRPNLLKNRQMRLKEEESLRRERLMLRFIEGALEGFESEGQRVNPKKE